MVRNEPSTDIPESYTEDEKALNEFLKLHPMLSLGESTPESHNPTHSPPRIGDQSPPLCTTESTSQKSLQLVANLTDQMKIPTVPTETVPRSHDEMFLRSANTRVGERQCCLGERCICRFVAMFRYGENTDMAFVGREFLLPSQHNEFVNTGKLPQHPGKCLLCMRYYQTYLFRLARIDPNFSPSVSVPITAYTNTVATMSGEEVPFHSSSVGDADGYPASAILAVEGDFASSEAGRSQMGTFLWRPVVGFHSSNYTYCKGEDGTVHIQQDFGVPASGGGPPTSA
jgi:hypothetical protein